MNRKIGKYRTTSNLSSETLFHLTGSFDILKLILTKGIQARYIYEKLPGKKMAYFTKTICFCDIPLSLIKEHVNWYGTYGVGINKAISRSNGLSPVLYIHSKSPNFPKGSSTSTLEWFKEFNFTHYLKQVRGKQLFFDDDNKPYWKWKTFYNEKEWRYFPLKNEIIVEQYSKEVELEMKRKQLNENELLNFDLKPEWIEYIIIKNSKELKALTDILKLPKYEPYYESLMTKVITFNQLSKDF